MAASSTISSCFVIFGAALVACFISSAMAIKCFQCGQYNDGVGSITPCINYTHMQMKECPSLEHKWCIKYVSEGSIVRDCVAQCTEKEVWGTKTFCCDLDGCNSSDKTQSTTLALIVACAIIPLILHHKMAVLQ